MTKRGRPDSDILRKRLSARRGRLACCWAVAGA